MFVDLMNDVAETFTDRFLKVQLVIEEDRPSDGASGSPFPPESAPIAPTRRYDALGVLEEVPAERGMAAQATLDVGPAETPTEKPTVARKDPVIVGAGKARSMNDIQNAAPSAPVDWSSVGRNDPCPCGSGRKFKKCHGVSV